MTRAESTRARTDADAVTQLRDSRYAAGRVIVWRRHARTGRVFRALCVVPVPLNIVGAISGTTPCWWVVLSTVIAGVAVVMLTRDIADAVRRADAFARGEWP